jgi:hypothetical protein
LILWLILFVISVIILLLSKLVVVVIVLSVVGVIIANQMFTNYYDIDKNSDFCIFPAAFYFVLVQTIYMIDSFRKSAKNIRQTFFK